MRYNLCITEEFQIIEQVPVPQFTRLGDLATRFLTPVANVTATWILEPDQRTPVQRQSPEVLDTAMRTVFAGLPGEAGEHLRAYYQIEPDEGKIAASKELPISENALEAAASYGEKEIGEALEHQRPMSIDEMWTSDDLENIVASLGDVVPDIDRWQLESAAKEIRYRLEQELSAK